MKIILILFFALCSHLEMSAALHCPSDITISCAMDPDNTNMTGVPSYFGPYSSIAPSYIDWVDDGGCNTGLITRTWFIDINYNNKVDAGEPACEQFITITDVSGDIVIVFPDNVNLECGDDDIPFTAPHWSSSPCDMLAYSYEDHDLIVGDGACAKIIREFTVINWCDYDLATGEGVWKHDQLIYFLDNEKPVLENCEDSALSTNDCFGTFTISNSATDTGFCLSESLRWEVHIDLWGDGSDDYVYGYTQSGAFNLDATSNGEEVNITLPVQVRKGHHKVKWKVSDGCGNVTSCHTIVHMRDTKPPTPFCHVLASSVLMNPSGFLEVAASDFVIKATDNCTPENQISYAFSVDPADSLRMFTCLDFGFQFLQVYVIDRYGNADYCNVFLLVFDNSGACNARAEFEGRITDVNGQGIEGAVLDFMKDEDYLASTSSAETGKYAFHDLEFRENMYLNTHVSDYNKNEITVADMLMMKRRILGEIDFDPIQQVLGDLDSDGKVGIYDLLAMRDLILQSDIPVEYLPGMWSEADSNYLFQQEFPIEQLVGLEEIIGFRKGDISSDYVNPWRTSLNIKPRNQIQIDYKVENGKASFYATEDLDIFGIQCSMEGALNQIEAGILSFSDKNVFAREASTTIFWYDEDGVKVQKDEILFSIDVNETDVNLAKNIAARIVTDSNLTEQEFVLTNRTEIAVSALNVKYFDHILQIFAPDENNYNIEILDLSGRKMYDLHNQKGTNEYDLSTLQSGIYIIHLYDEEAQTKVSSKIFHD